MKNTLICLSILTLSGLASTSYADNERTMLVLDASGSMWGQLEGKTKIEIAREAMSSLVKDWPAEREAGLVAYGHRKKGDCSDIETLIPVGPLDAEKMTTTVNGLNPKGKTPLSAAVKQAAEALKYTEEKATVVLLSDGKETCNMDPCALGTELEKLGVDFTAHVIGFDVTKTQDQAGLRCLAENTGGQFIPAGSAKELNAALEQTAKAPEPESEAEPVPQARIIAPESAIKATEIAVALEAEEGLDGYVELHTPGKKKKLAYGYVKKDDVTGYKPATIRLPALTGGFQLKWVTKKGEVIAETAITLTEAEVKLQAPGSAIMGTEIEVALKAPEGLDGYIEIHPQGKKKKLSYGYVKAGDVQGYKPAKVRLPALTGNFVLKWVTKKGESIAETPITLNQAEVKLLSSESAPKSTELSVELEAPEGLDGYIELHPQGKKKKLTYGYVKADDIKGYKPAKMRLPALTGNFELKWVTKRGEVIARTPLKLDDIDVSLIAPEQAEKGTGLPVALNAPDGLEGYIHLYPKGNKKSITYGYVKADDVQGYKPAKIKLPDLTGDFVLKWQTKRGEVLTEQALKIVDKIVE